MKNFFEKIFYSKFVFNLLKIVCLFLLIFLVVLLFIILISIAVGELESLKEMMLIEFIGFIILVFVIGNIEFFNWYFNK